MFRDQSCGSAQFGTFQAQILKTEQASGAIRKSGADGTRFAAGQVMHILLRHALTGQYYRSLGKWTTHPEEAHDFRFVDRAVRFVRNFRSPNMEVDVSFDSPEQAASFCFKKLFARN